MTENLNNSEGFNYSPEIDVKNSNVDPKIEEIEVRVNKTKDTRKIRLLKNPIKYFYDASILNKSIYLEKTDSKNIPFIKHIEKYPDLPEDVFIPIEFSETDENKYFINKSGEVYSIDLGILKGAISSYGYLQQSLTNKFNEVKTYFSHRLTALTFIYNPDTNIYTLVNHIDSNKKNCNVSNLEWVTVSGNNLKKNIKTYTKQNINSLIGFSGNVNDYKWMEHWKYPRVYVCKEGFIMYNSKRVGSMTSTYKYIHIKISNKNGVVCDGYAQRIIMEYIIKRDLLPEEEVDHINTIPYDNSFSNLKLTDHKGNMNNQLTIEKRYKRIVLADLYGDFYKYDTVKSIQEEITGRKINRENLRSSL